MDENSSMQSLAAALLVVPFMLHGPSENKIKVTQCVCTLLCVEERQLAQEGRRILISVVSVEL